MGRFDKVILVGVGGTGTHLLEPLARLLGYHENQTRDLIIIDGDVYEEKNMTRQLFDKSFIGKNKAAAAASRIAFDGFNVFPVQGYINKIDFLNVILESIDDVTEKNILIITAVDNHATRKDLITAVDEKGLKNFTFISPGNDLDMGQIVVWAKEDGKNLTIHPFEKYPDLQNPKDRIPGGCAEQAPSTPQLITANGCAAISVLLTVSAILDDLPWYEEIHFSCQKMKLVPQGDPIMSPASITRRKAKIEAAAKAAEEEAQRKAKEQAENPPQPVMATPILKPVLSGPATEETIAVEIEAAESKPSEDQNKETQNKEAQSVEIPTG